MCKNTHQEQKAEFRANLRAIENAVTNASLDGGCDFADDVIYHCELIRNAFDKVCESLENEETHLNT